MVCTVDTNKPNVAVLSSPGLGHVIPLLELAKRLVINHDCHVSYLVITTSEASSAAEDQLLQPPNLPPGLDVVYLQPVNVNDIVTDEMQILTRLCVIVDKSLQSLASVLIDLGKPKALIIDLFCTQAFAICEELSIPVYSFVTTSAAFLAFSLYLPALDQQVDGEFVDLPEPIEIPGCSPVQIEDLLDQARNRSSDDYKWLLLNFSRLTLATGLIVNSWEELEPVSLSAIRENRFFKQIATPLIFLVGPLIRQNKPVADSGAECLAWLDKQPADSVLFVSLGSGGTLSAEQLNELAWGLQMSQQRFVFVVRKPNDATASGSFFNVGSEVNDPTSYLPQGFLEKTQGEGLIVSEWAPQVAILSHASIGGFLSHCGWNSTLESIAYGVPMIAWPLYAEQRMNATMLEAEVKVAVKPRVGEPVKRLVRREEVERVVRLLMEGEEGKAMRLRARELKESAAKTLNDSGSSCELLSCLAQKWKF